MKTYRFATALIIYVVFWLTGYSILLQKDPNGLGAAMFGFLLLMCNIGMGMTAIVLMLVTRLHHFSIVSYVAALFGATIFIVSLMLLGMPGIFRQVSPVYIAAVCAGCLIFLVQLYVMFRGKRAGNP
jgi:hypothetical protein